jgi:hypothetical protein
MGTTSRALAILILCAGCGGDGDPVDTGLIGADGGTVTTGGAVLTVPAGALDAEVEIGIATTDDADPDGFVSASPIFRFTPEGLVFSVPVDVAIDFTGAADGIGLIWSLPAGDGFESLGGTIEGQTVTGQVTHFSRGFAGKAAVGGGCGDGAACAGGLVCVGGQCVEPPGECTDGIDNDDTDTLVDAADDGCFGPYDQTEEVDCADGIDNDGDGLIDTVGPTTSVDPGCTSATDGSELPDCADGVDNDDDGLIDFGSDPNCASATGAYESADGA